MQKKKENVFLSPKHKIVYLIASSILSFLVLFILGGLTISGNDLVSTNSAIFSYCTALYLLLVIFAMLIDEAIKKYPGLLVLCASALYSFVYVCICFIKGGQTITGYIIVSFYFVYIGLSYLIYKHFYPAIVLKEKNKVFNTMYLIVFLMVTIVFGFMYSV